MPPKLSSLVSKGIAHPPSGYDQLIQYECYMGSDAYGCSADGSDLDCYGFLIPPKEMIFPHLRGEIEGFGEKGPRFNVYTEHHLVDPDAQGGRGVEYDYSIYNIISYFNLCMGANPNMVDSLFVPERCLLHMTPIGQMVRENRKIFLSTKVWHTFKGYAYQQLHKLRIKDPKAGSKRRESIDKYGYDVKFAYHIPRLLNECQQLLEEGELDLERSKEQLKSIRRGEWKIEDIEAYFQDRINPMEELYNKSNLPKYPQQDKIKELLLTCLEQHFGSLSAIVVTEDRAMRALRRIEDIVAETLRSQE